MATLQWQLTRFSDHMRLGGDVLVAVSLALLTVATALAAGGSSTVGRICAVIAAGGLAVLVERRQRPLLVLVAVFAVVFVEELCSPHAYGVSSFLAIMVATLFARRVCAKTGAGAGGVGRRRRRCRRSLTR